MMEQQKTEQKTENETNVKLDAKACEKDYNHLDIDFNNIEDILDFSACHSQKTVNSQKKKPKKRPPRRRKMIAKEPVELFEIQPEIENSVGQNSDDNKKEEQEAAPKCKKERKFQCKVCKRKFVRSTHLSRHMLTHTKAKPYSCKICRKRFSRSDHVQIHERSHYKHKIHSCCVCGRLYFDLQLFTAHGRLHAENECVKGSTNTAKENEALIRKQLQIVQKVIASSDCAEQIALLGCINIEEIDTHTGGEYIVSDNNSVCSPRHQTVNTEATSLSNDTTASSTSYSSSCDEQLIVSIKLPLQTM